MPLATLPSSLVSSVHRKPGDVHRRTLLPEHALICLLVVVVALLHALIEFNEPFDLVRPCLALHLVHPLRPVRLVRPCLALRLVHPLRLVRCVFHLVLCERIVWAKWNQHSTRRKTLGEWEGVGTPARPHDNTRW